MRISPKNVIARIMQVIRAWTNLRPAKSFAGMTLEQYKGRVQASLDVRAQIEETESKLRSLIATRATLDEASYEATSRVVDGVKADVEEGKDGELYAAMGYVRQSHRSTGRRRAKANGAAAPADASAASPAAAPAAPAATAAASPPANGTT